MKTINTYSQARRFNELYFKAQREQLEEQEMLVAYFEPQYIRFRCNYHRFIDYRDIYDSN